MTLGESIGIAFNLLLELWWVYTPVILLLILIDTWGSYNREKYLSSIKWTLLQIKVPKETTTTPSGTEHIFFGLHGILIKPLTWDERFFKGKVPEWFSLEIAGNNGDIGFYLRMPEQYRNLVESNIYAQYPDAEVVEVEDYLNLVPESIPTEEYDLFGMELALIKDSAFPIRTYEEFENIGAGRDVEKLIDPLAVLGETLGKLKLGEHIWIQFLIRPVGDTWAKEGEAALDKILGRDKPPVEGEPPRDKRLSPSERIVAEGVSNKLSKLGFETVVRYIYAGKKDIFSMSNSAAISGVFKQFTTLNLNGFKANVATIPSANWNFKFLFEKWPFKHIPVPGKAQKEYEKKKELFVNYKSRAFGDDFFVLNTAELASLYHLPSMDVKSPMLGRIEAKKGQPPVGLPLAEDIEE